MIRKPFGLFLERPRLDLNAMIPRFQRGGLVGTGKGIPIVLDHGYVIVHSVEAAKAVKPLVDPRTEIIVRPSEAA